jgi:transcriptional regulator with XRE-family HTH domain
VKAQPDTERLRARLREAREYLGLTQEFVAKHTGILRSAIADIERGARRVDSLELKKLAKLYRYPIQYFLDEEPEIAAPQSTISALARTANELTEDDRQEVLRYAEYLRSYKKGSGRSKE